MSIVVTTPTGNIGRHVVRELMNAGKSIRVIVRNPNKLGADVRAYAKIVQGSIDDAAILTEALNGAEALFWCVPQSNTQENVLEYYLHFARAAATAIQQTGTPRIVAVSSGGKGIAKNAGPISALHAIDDVLDATGAAIKYLRCGHFMDNLLWQVEPIVQQGVFFYPLPSDFPIPMVATCDIGAMAVRWLIHQDWLGQSGIGVHGPEDFSLNQVAETLSKAFSKPVRFQPVPPKAYYESILSHGSSPAFAQSLVDMFAAVAEGIYRAEPRTLDTTTPTTLRQWVENVMLPVAL
ncbi:hypothetical protein BZZ01_14195 [Nostocales cyanobacterium HT-58-2]|nr:hypothetical protein BZZ01_14195 [Nostocales cyanobacterium HT-58-2]